jgi:hypothetical protein
MARTSLIQWEAPRLYKQSLSSTVGFTTDYVSDDYITSTSHGLSVGDLIEFVEVDTLQSPLLEDTIYTVFHVQNANEFSITLNGSTVVSIADDGSNDNAYKVYNTNVTLENFTILQDAPENRAFWHESVINNHRELVNTDRMHWYIEINMNLFKESTLATRKTNFTELFGYLYENVYITRCNIDSNCSTLIRDSVGDPVTFVMDKFETAFLTQANYEDLLTIGLRSKDPIDLSKTI